MWITAIHIPLNARGSVFCCYIEKAKLFALLSLLRKYEANGAADMGSNILMTMFCFFSILVWYKFFVWKLLKLVVFLFPSRKYINANLISDAAEQDCPSCGKYCWFLTHEEIGILLCGNPLIMGLEITSCMITGQMIQL